MILKQLKGLLNSYMDKELEEMELWINDVKKVDSILASKSSISLVTNDVDIKIDGLLTKEGDKD